MQLEPKPKQGRTWPLWAGSLALPPITCGLTVLLSTSMGGRPLGDVAPYWVPVALIANLIWQLAIACTAIVRLVRAGWDWRLVAIIALCAGWVLLGIAFGLLCAGVANTTM